MYEIRNNRNEVVRKEEVFILAKEDAFQMDSADKQYKLGNGPFSIYEAKQIWITQTLEEIL